MKKKLLAILLMLSLVITCMPMVALAADDGGFSVENATYNSESGKYEVEYDEENPKIFNITFTAPNSGVKAEDIEMNYAYAGNVETAGALQAPEILQSATTNITNIGEVNLNKTWSGTSVTVNNSLYYTVPFKFKADAKAGDVATFTAKKAEYTGEDLNTTGLFQTMPEIKVQLKGTDGVEKLTRDAHIKGNVLDVTEEYNVVILYNDDAVYTYIPNGADVKEAYQNPESSVTAENPTAGDIIGKWCGYGGGVGFDGNQNRITIINGMDVAGTVTATAAKETGLNDTFSINLKTLGAADGSANYDILRKACITGSTGEPLNAAFNQCGALANNAKFGTKVIPTEGIELGAINTQGNEIKYANIYYDLTGAPGTGVTKYVSGGGAASTKLGTITITVKAA